MARWKDDFASLDVFARLHHVLAVGYRPDHFYSSSVNLLGVFHHDYGVGTAGQHAAGIGQGRVARPHGNSRGLAHGDIARDSEIGRRPFRRAEGVGGA